MAGILSTLYGLGGIFSLPFTAMQLSISVMRGREPISSAVQRLGLSLDARREGPLIWFHAAGIVECSVALPVLFRSLLEYNDKVMILLTTESVEAYLLLKETLPGRVTVQLTPMDTPVCITLFMRKWRPQVGLIMDSPLHPNLVLVAAQYGVRMALLNGRLAGDDVLSWHSLKARRARLSNVISKFDLIVPASDMDFGHFCLFGAGMKQMPGWCGDLTHSASLGAGTWHLSKPKPEAVKQLRTGLGRRPTWIAAHTQPGEESFVGRVHHRLATQVPGLRTIMVPVDGGRCAGIMMALREQHGLSVDMWRGPNGTYIADVILVDDASQLPLLYTVCETVLLANSSLLDSEAANAGEMRTLRGCDLLAAPAVSSCAVLVGAHGGAASAMAEDLNAAAVAAAEDVAAAVRSAGSAPDDDRQETPVSLQEDCRRQQLQQRTMFSTGRFAVQRPRLGLDLMAEPSTHAASAPVTPSGAGNGSAPLAAPWLYNAHHPLPQGHTPPVDTRSRRSVAPAAGGNGHSSRLARSSAPSAIWHSHSISEQWGVDLPGFAASYSPGGAGQEDRAAAAVATAAERHLGHAFLTRQQSGRPLGSLWTVISGSVSRGSSPSVAPAPPLQVADFWSPSHHARLSQLPPLDMTRSSTHPGDAATCSLDDAVQTRRASATSSAARRTVNFSEHASNEQQQAPASGRAAALCPAPETAPVAAAAFFDAPPATGLELQEAKQVVACTVPESPSSNASGRSDESLNRLRSMMCLPELPSTEDELFAEVVAAAAAASGSTTSFSSCHEVLASSPQSRRLANSGSMQSDGTGSSCAASDIVQPLEVSQRAAAMRRQSSGALATASGLFWGPRRPPDGCCTMAEAEGLPVARAMRFHRQSFGRWLDIDTSPPESPSSVPRDQQHIIQHIIQSRSNSPSSQNGPSRGGSVGGATSLDQVESGSGDSPSLSPMAPPVSPSCHRLSTVSSDAALDAAVVILRQDQKFADADGGNAWCTAAAAVAGVKSIDESESASVLAPAKCHTASITACVSAEDSLNLATSQLNATKMPPLSPCKPGAVPFLSTWKSVSAIEPPNADLRPSASMGAAGSEASLRSLTRPPEIQDQIQVLPEQQQRGLRSFLSLPTKMQIDRRTGPATNPTVDRGEADSSTDHRWMPVDSSGDLESSGDIDGDGAPDAAGINLAATASAVSLVTMKEAVTPPAASLADTGCGPDEDAVPSKPQDVERSTLKGFGSVEGLACAQPRPAPAPRPGPARLGRDCSRRGLPPALPAHATPPSWACNVETAPSSWSASAIGTNSELNSSEVSLRSSSPALISPTAPWCGDTPPPPSPPGPIAGADAGFIFPVTRQLHRSTSAAASAANMLTTTMSWTKPGTAGAPFSGNVLRHHATMPQAMLLSLLDEAEEAPDTPRSCQQRPYDPFAEEEEDLGIPETPTSRMSCASPFATGAVYDRPSPFRLSRTGSHVSGYDAEEVAHSAASVATAAASLYQYQAERAVQRGLTSPSPSTFSRRTSASGLRHARSDSRGSMERRASAHPCVSTKEDADADSSGSGGAVPDTPTSMMSNSSPFAGSVRDRPCPFRVSNSGGIVPSSAVAACQEAAPVRASIASSPGSLVSYPRQGLDPAGSYLMPTSGPTLPDATDRLVRQESMELWCRRSGAERGSDPDRYAQPPSPRVSKASPKEWDPLPANAMSPAASQSAAPATITVAPVHMHLRPLLPAQHASASGAAAGGLSNASPGRRLVRQMSSTPAAVSSVAQVQIQAPMSSPRRARRNRSYGGNIVGASRFAPGKQSMDSPRQQDMPPGNGDSSGTEADAAAAQAQASAPSLFRSISAPGSALLQYLQAMAEAATEVDPSHDQDAPAAAPVVPARALPRQLDISELLPSPRRQRDQPPLTPRKQRSGSPERPLPIPAALKQPPMSPHKSMTLSRCASMAGSTTPAPLDCTTAAWHELSLLRAGSFGQGRHVASVGVGSMPQGLLCIGTPGGATPQGTGSNADQPDRVTSPTASSALRRSPFPSQSPFADYAAACSAAAAVIVASPHTAGCSLGEIAAEIAVAAVAGLEAANAAHGGERPPVSPRSSMTDTADSCRPSPYRKLLMDVDAEEPQAMPASAKANRMTDEMGTHNYHAEAGLHATQPGTLPRYLAAPFSVIIASSPMSARGGGPGMSAASSPYCKLNFDNTEVPGSSSGACCQKQLSWGDSNPASPVSRSPSGLEGLEHLTLKTLRLPRSPSCMSPAPTATAAAAAPSGGSCITAAALPHGAISERSPLSLQQKVLLRQAHHQVASGPQESTLLSCAQQAVSHPQGNSSPRSSLFQELQGIKEQLMGVEGLLVKQREALAEPPPAVAPASPLSPAPADIRAAAGDVGNGEVALELSAMRQQMSAMAEMMMQQSAQMHELKTMVANQQHMRQLGESHKALDSSCGSRVGGSLQPQRAARVNDAGTAGQQQCTLQEGDGAAAATAAAGSDLSPNLWGSRSSRSLCGDDEHLLLIPPGSSPVVAAAATVAPLGSRPRRRPCARQHRVSYDTADDQLYIPAGSMLAPGSGGQVVAAGPSSSEIEVDMAAATSPCGYNTAPGDGDSIGLQNSCLLSSLTQSGDRSPLSVQPVASAERGQCGIDCHDAPLAVAARHPTLASASGRGEAGAGGGQPSRLAAAAGPQPRNPHLDKLRDQGSASKLATAASSNSSPAKRPDAVAAESPFVSDLSGSVSSKGMQLQTVASHVNHQQPHAASSDLSPAGSSGGETALWDSSPSSARLYRGGYLMPASQLPRGAIGPAVWRVGDETELVAALATLLRDPLERRSRGHAAAQAAAKLAMGLVSTVWNVLDDAVVTPALHAYVERQLS